MPEPLLLLVALAIAAAAVAWPILTGRGESRSEPVPEDDDDRRAALLRRRIALEEIRELEADRRAGTIDDATYIEQLADAEARAAAAVVGDRSPGPARPVDRVGRRAAAGAAVVIGGLLVLGSVVPATGIANPTETNRALADAEAREAIRQERIGDLLAALEANPDDPDALSDLADAYLEGTTRDDLVVAATLLRALIDLEPERADAYERIIAAYLRADDATNAAAALGAYEGVSTADPVELAFYAGLVARAAGDRAEAVAAFDRFLELAPDDPRADMIRGLRDDLRDD